MVEIRRADPAEIEALATLWHDGWMDAHAAHVPAALTRLRTRSNFRERLEGFGELMRVAGPVGAPVGLCVVKGAELDQLFVSSAARGTGAAQALLADGEARIAAAGHAVATLDCAIGNDRAARFYRKCGWRLRGEEEVELDTSDGPFALTTWVFEKRVAGA
ncbi:MAG: GNAT family N-acetyltransferase [Pseudomonadota bacterium]